jgi:5-methyltetrahydropteroyltriglutamate--homocysteine methyltransferase
VASVYRAESLGSLLRPHYLMEARRRWSAGEIPTSEFKRVEDRAVDQAIALQEGAGLDVVTDAEMRRIVFFDQFIRGLQGVSETPAAPVHFHASQPENDIDFQSPLSVTGKVRGRRMVTLEEFAYARAKARLPVKVTLPSPLLLFAMWSPEYSRDAYPDPFDMFADAVEVVRAEAAELAAMGCRYIQIDAPEFVQVFADENQRENWRRLGIPPERVFSEGVELVNAVADVPGVTFGLHLCRGNYQSRWIASGGYEEFARQVFPRATNYDTFLLEYDDERSGSFEPLSHLPDDKVAVLGLISTKRDELEDADEIRRRIADAGNQAGLDRLALSTQCGFASDASGNLISEARQEEKLHLVAELAHEIWP